MGANYTSTDDVKAYISQIKEGLLNYRNIGIVKWKTALDNHNPAPRDYGVGFAVKYTHDNVDEGYALFHDNQFGDDRKLAFLIDDGEKVRCFYLASWNALGGFFILHPFPIGIHLGPRKMYYMKVKQTWV